MTNNKNRPACTTIDEVKSAIDGVVRKIDTTPQLIFRGENKEFLKISSTLYREQESSIRDEADKKNLDDIIKDIDLDDIIKDIDIARIQEEDVNALKKHFSDIPLVFEILAEVQHYGGKTNLIDFSKNFLIALFFACYGESKEQGRLICLDASKFERVKPSEEIDYNQSYFFESNSKNNRIIFQNSVFIYHEQGFLDPNDQHIIYIDASGKKDILQELKTYYGIHTDTIYNDIHGFIEHGGIERKTIAYFNMGLSAQQKENNKLAIQFYDNAIELKPDYAKAYNNRGVAKSDLGEKKNAIKDYDNAIELKPDFAEAYNNRGNAKSDLGRIEDAIKDYDEAIELKPDFAKAYNNRGNANYTLGKTEQALSDFKTVIKLAPSPQHVQYAQKMIDAISKKQNE